MLRQLCGTDNFNTVVLATTHWTDANGVSVSEHVCQARIKVLTETHEFWGGMVGKGSQIVKHDGSKKSALEIVSNLVDRHIRVTLDIQKQLIDQRRSLFDTDAGKALRMELIAERKSLRGDCQS